MDWNGVWACRRARFMKSDRGGRRFMNAAPMFVVSLTAFMRAAQAPSPSEAHLVQISALCCCCDTLRWLRSLHRGSEPQCRPHERSKQKVGVVLVEKSRGRRCQQRTPSRPSRSLPRCPAAAHINTPNNSQSTAQRSLLLTLSSVPWPISTLTSSMSQTTTTIPRARRHRRRRPMLLRSMSTS